MTYQADKYGHLIDPDQTEVVRLPVIARDGQQAVDEDGQPVYEMRETPYHLPAAPSWLDPTGLVPSPCQHGLPVHPDPAIMAGANAKRARAGSWIKSRYVTLVRGGAQPTCVVCQGGSRPADFTSGYVVNAEGEVVLGDG